MFNGSFRLEINSFADFVAFVAIIRGKELDSAEITKLVQTLKTSNDALAKAEEENKNA